jgi:hypothetical protein
MITQKKRESVKSSDKEKKSANNLLPYSFLTKFALQQHSVLDSILLQTLLLKKLFSFVFGNYFRSDQKFWMRFKTP